MWARVTNKNENLGVVFWACAFWEDASLIFHSLSWWTRVNQEGDLYVGLGANENENLGE